MTEIVEFLLTVAAVWLIYKGVRFVVKRARLVRSLQKLSALHSAKLTFLRFPLLPLSGRSKKPDVRLEFQSTVYLIRLYNGKGASRSVHFASEEYSVIYNKIKTAIRAPKTQRGGRAVLNVGLSVGGKVRILTPICKENYAKNNKKTVSILLFTPAPGEVSYVSEERTSVRVAFTGDEFYGMKIFTRSTLISFLDREARREKEEMEKQLFYGF